MTDSLLPILCCPKDRSKLSRAPAELVRAINGAIDAGELHTRTGRRLEKKIDGGLIRAQGDLLYPIQDQIPVMLYDEAIPLVQLRADMK